MATHRLERGHTQCGRRTHRSSRFTLATPVVLGLALAAVGSAGITRPAAGNEHPNDPRQLLLDAYHQLSNNGTLSYYGMPSSTKAPSSAQALPLYNGQAVVTWLSIPGKHGQRLTMEVQSGSPRSVFLGVPHPTANASLWFEMERSSNGTFVPRAQPVALSTPFPMPPVPSHMRDSGKWNGHAQYGFGHLDMPHWVQIISGPMGTQNSSADRQIHDLAWSNAPAGMAFLDTFHKPNEDLQDRARNPWAPLTVRGKVTSSHLSTDDWGPHHAKNYGDAQGNCDFGQYGKLCPSGTSDWGCVGVGADWSGFDWDMNMETDPDTEIYTAGPPNHTAGTLGLEIEHFALPPAYRPLGPESTAGKPDWLQATGRLVIDAGHSDFGSEIHPPELLVSSRQSPKGHVQAWVVTTGAWMGEKLSFFVNPPPRPKPTSKLHYTLHKADGEGGYDARRGTDLTITELPSKEMPNHLMGVIDAKGYATLGFYDNGAVCQSNAWALQVVVETWWDDGESTEVNARVLAGSSPAKGAALFYGRAEDIDNGAPWTVARLDDKGETKLSLAPESYYFRPAGSEYDFAGVPKLVRLKPGTNDVVLNASSWPGKAAKPAMPHVPELVARREGHGRSVTGSGSTPKKDPLANAAFDAYAVEALTLKVTTDDAHGRVPDHYGTLGSESPSRFKVLVHLASLIDAKGQPVTDLEAAYKKPLQGPHGSESYPGGSFLTAKPGPGVAGATIHARLILGNAAVGYRTAADLPSVTLDASGMAGLTLEAGTHVEEAYVSIEVTNNPKNPWFLPGVRNARAMLFQPQGIVAGKVTDDTVQETPYHLLPPERLTNAAAATAFLGQIKDAQEQVAHELQLAVPPASLPKSKSRSVALGRAPSP